MRVGVSVSREYGTDRPCLIGRIEEPNGRITLAFRYTDDGSGWFPSWLGRSGEEATQVPPGWSLSDEMVDVLEAHLPPAPNWDEPFGPDPTKYESDTERARFRAEARLSAAEPQTTGEDRD